MTTDKSGKEFLSQITERLINQLKEQAFLTEKREKSPSGKEYILVDLAVVGGGTSALTYLYAHAKKLEGQNCAEFPKTVVLGLTGLWRQFKFSINEEKNEENKIEILKEENIKSQMGQPHEFLYTLDCWNSWQENPKIKKGGEDYMKVGEYIQLLDELDKKIGKMYSNNIAFLPLFVNEIKYNNSDQEEKDYPYYINSQIGIIKEVDLKNEGRGGALKVVFLAKKVIVATGLPLEKENKDLKNLKANIHPSIKLNDSSFVGVDLFNQFSKKAKFVSGGKEKEYEVLVNGSKYVTQRDVSFYENNSEPYFAVAVDGSGPTAAWAVERAMSNGITDIRWISKYDFKRANAWGRNDKIIQNAAKKGILYMGDIKNIEWLGTGEEQPATASVKLTVKPIPEPRRRKIFIETICGVIAKKLATKIPSDDGENALKNAAKNNRLEHKFEELLGSVEVAEKTLKLLTQENQEFALNVRVTKEVFQVGLKKESDEIVFDIQVPEKNIQVTRKEFQVGLKKESDKIVFDIQVPEKDIQVTKKEIQVGFKKESDKTVLDIQVPAKYFEVKSDDFQDELFYQLTGIQPNNKFGKPKIKFIEKEETWEIYQYINAPGTGNYESGFFNKKIEDNLTVIRDTESRITEGEQGSIIGLNDNKGLKIIGPAAHQYIDKNPKRFEEKAKEKYGKIMDLFSQTNNTSDGIAVTRAAIKVLTKFEELPSEEDLKNLENKESEAKKIENLTEVFKFILKKEEEAKKAAKYFYFFNWNTTDLLETRKYFQEIFDWEEKDAKRAAHKFIFGSPIGSPNEKFLEARDDRKFGFTQEDLIGLDEEEVLGLRSEDLSNSENIGKIKDSVLYKLKQKIETKQKIDK